MTDTHYTPVPTVLLERLHLLSEHEVRVILAVCQRALGKHRDPEWFVNWRVIQELSHLNEYQATVGVVTLQNRRWLTKAEAEGVDVWQLNLRAIISDARDAIAGEEVAE